jgi:hypothetical protein
MKIYSGETYDISFDVMAASQIVSIETGFASAYTSTGPTAYSVPLSLMASGYNSTSFTNKTKSVTATGTNLNSVFVIKINLTRSANIQEYYFKNLSLCSSGSSLKSSENVMFTNDGSPSKNEVFIYPNPSEDGRFNIQISNTDEAIESITITDLNGRKVLNKNVDTAASVELNTRGILEPGIYVVNIKTTTEFVTKKLIIK